MTPVHEVLAARAEILKLARLLGVPPERLAYLEEVPAADIRQLREQATDMLFTAHDGALGRLAAASRLLPVGLVALIGERAFGPILAARIAGLLEPHRAVEIAGRLPTEFLADVAVELDPRRAIDVIAGIPPEQIVEVSLELTRRGEFVAMGRFVGHLPLTTLSAAVRALSDADVLRAAFVMEEKDRLDELADVLGEERLSRVIDAAEREGLWLEALDLLGHLGRERQAALIEVARARLDDARQAEIAELAREAGLLERPGPLRDLLVG